MMSGHAECAKLDVDLDTVRHFGFIALPAKLTLRISGADVSPDSVQLVDLIGLLRDFQVAVSASAAASGVPKEEIRISLTSIRTGSDVLGFATNQKTHRHASRLVGAIDRDDPSKLVPRARLSVQSMWRRAVTRGWTLEINARRGNGHRRATIAPHVEPFASARATGATSQIAYILRWRRKADGSNPACGRSQANRCALAVSPSPKSWATTCITG